MGNLFIDGCHYSKMFDLIYYYYKGIFDKVLFRSLLRAERI